MNEWLDRHMGRLFLAPAVTLILIFSIFPLVASLIMAFARIRFSGGGYKVRFVGWRNFEKLLFGSEQFHLLGTFTQISVLGWVFGLLATAALLWWIVKYVRTRFTFVGFLGRLITLAMG
ncbi:MAG: sugar ABC transporter permease, partial [Pseudomonadota bacterium]